MLSMLLCFHRLKMPLKVSCRGALELISTVIRTVRSTVCRCQGAQGLMVAMGCFRCGLLTYRSPCETANGLPPPR